MSIEALATGDTVVVQSATHAVGSSFGDSRTWADGTTYDCLIQDNGDVETRAYSARGSKYRYMVFFSEDVSLTVNNRLKQTVMAGTTLTVPRYLRVEAYEADGRPGEGMLWMAFCSLETTRPEG